jgi:hypothetical protein
MLNEYIDFWRQLDCDNGPFIHPADKPLLLSDRFKKVHGGHRDSDRQSKTLHLDLLPAPHTGDIARAEIILLMLNPSTAARDYDDHLRPDYRRRLVQNIRQEFAGVEFPCLALDPAFESTGGFEYWESGRMLRGVIAEVTKREGSRKSGLRLLANKIATVEIIAYKSIKFDAGMPFDELPSARLARRFVNEYLKPAAAQGDKLVIVMRGVKRLGFKYDSIEPGFVLYPRVLAQSANLGVGSPGGQAILKRLNA